MSQSPFARLTACLLLGAMLAGCGGDDGPTPPPVVIGGSGGSGGGTPTPSPPITNNATFGTLGATSSQTYAVLGFSILGKSGAWGYDVDPQSIDFDYPIAFRFDAGGRAFDITLDGLTSRMQANGGGSTDPSGQITSLSYWISRGSAYLQRIDFNGDSKSLTHTFRGGWAISGGTNAYPTILGEFLYGIPTPANSMPTSAQVQFEGYEYRGDFTVDFAARTVSGSIVRGDNGTEPFLLSDVAFLTTDPSRFVGKLTLSGVEKGTIEGQFTGPAAQEMMLVYQTTINDPTQANGTVLAAGRKPTS